MITEEALKDIFKPHHSKLKTSITKVEPNRLITRGYLQEDLIENISFSEMIHLLIKGKLPSKNEAKMLGAVLVSFCDHGLTPPSTQTARIMASTGSPLNACIAGGILAFGKNHAGAIEEAMKTFQEAIKLSKENIDELAEQIVHYFIKNDKKIFGYGHRYHTEDPRAIKLIEMAKKYKCFGKHSELAIEIEKIIFDLKGIKMNIDGANGAVLSDMGFNWRFGSGIFMIGRLPGILTHINEEKTREDPFRRFFENDEIHYDGIEPCF